MVRYIFKQVFQAVYDLHTVHKRAHLDIKLENIVIGDDLELLLIDFDHSCPVGQICTTKTGTPQYQAPEILTYGRLKY